MIWYWIGPKTCVLADTQSIVLSISHAGIGIRTTLTKLLYILAIEALGIEIRIQEDIHGNCEYNSGHKLALFADDILLFVLLLLFFFF